MAVAPYGAVALRARRADVGATSTGGAGRFDGRSAGGPHGKGLLHLDITRSNVMLRGDGTPVLIDFGNVRRTLVRHSRAPVLGGGHPFTPWEQFLLKDDSLGPWTDIYALGAVAYWALSERPPTGALNRLREDRLEPFAEVACGPVSATLATAVAAALAVDCTDRPQSMEQWRSLLELPASGDMGA